MVEEVFVYRRPCQGVQALVLLFLLGNVPELPVHTRQGSQKHYTIADLIVNIKETGSVNAAAWTGWKRRVLSRSVTSKRHR